MIEYDVMMGGTTFNNISIPNDSTYFIAGKWGDGENAHIRVWNYSNEFAERWNYNVFNCELCIINPKQLLPLSNGNLAIMYDKVSNLNSAFMEREEAIIVILDGTTGEQIGNDILVGDYEGNSIWAGGMVEVDGNIMVSYTEPYYFDDTGQWHFSDSSNVQFQWFTTAGELVDHVSLLEETPSGIDVPSGYQYRVSQMQHLDDGNILVTGTSGYGGMLLKVNQEGDLIWFREHFPHDPEENNALTWETNIFYATPTSDGGFLCAGQYRSDPGSLYPSGIQTAFALKVDEYGCLEPGCQVGVEELSLQQDLVVYPNPNNGQFNIQLPATYGNQLSIYNPLGQLVQPISYPTGVQYSIDLSTHPKGIYQVLLHNEDGGVFRAKVVVE